MEQIRQAVERAKASGMPAAEAQSRMGISRPRHSSDLSASRPEMTAQDKIKEVELNRNHLESHRIIAHNAADPRSNSFDMLRTQILQSMDKRNWQFLAVTSPTPGCGKTVTAVNLALSITCQPERSVLLVDMDLPRPQVASTLGVRCQHGLLSVLDGRAALANAMIQARVDSHRFMVLPTEAPILGSSELIASRAMSNLLQGIKRDFRARTVILDMPPMLSSDDVIAMLPQIDCVLLVAAVGNSTVSEIKECNRHLQATEVVRLVLNKSADSTTRYMANS
jgi:Mrp family chromosome partitioning ATPase